MDIVIRPGLAADADFLVACNAAMALETEGKALDPGVLGPGVRTLLARPELGFYLVAEQSAQPAGCLMVTQEWSDWRNGLFWWVQSVYVLPVFRRMGIYRRLYLHVKDSARAARNVIGFRLYVEKDNLAAQRTYAAMGMEETDYKLFEEGLRP